MHQGTGAGGGGKQTHALGGYRGFSKRREKTLHCTHTANTESHF